MRRREGFVFLSAPDATTPVHFDPEHNLLLQIRGQKDMNVGRFADPAEQQRELDRYHDGGHRNLERVPEDVECFRLTPGRGVYVHPFAPHFVQNGPAASVSLSITFRTRATERTERAHRANAVLRRRLRAKPRPAGSSALGRRRQGHRDGRGGRAARAALGRLAAGGAGRTTESAGPSASSSHSRASSPALMKKTATSMPDLRQQRRAGERRRHRLPGRRQRAPARHAARIERPARPTRNSARPTTPVSARISR